MATREELRNALDQFDSVRFSSESAKQNIEWLNKTIYLGENLFSLAPLSEYSDVPPYVAFQLQIPYLERARYYGHKASFFNAEHPENIQQSISDYSRLLELIEMEQPPSTKWIARNVYEERCECYLTIGKTGEALLDAKYLVSNFPDALAYIFRSKIFLSLGLFDQAKEDIAVVISIAENPIHLSEAISIQKMINTNVKFIG